MSNETNKPPTTNSPLYCGAEADALTRQGWTAEDIKAFYAPQDD